MPCIYRVYSVSLNCQLIILKSAQSAVRLRTKRSEAEITRACLVKSRFLSRD